MNIPSGDGSNVTNNAFVNCKANCIYMQNVNGTTVNNNVFYKAWVIGVEVNKATYITVHSNLIIGVTGRPTLQEGSELTACIAMVEYSEPLTGMLTAKNNFCLGSSQHGFAFPFQKCSDS